MKTPVVILAIVAALVLPGCASNPKKKPPQVRSAAVGVQIQELDKSLPEIKASSQRQAELIKQLNAEVEKL